MGALKNISNIFKYGFRLIIVAVMLGVGIFIGRKSVKLPEPTEPTIEYIEAEPIHDTITTPGKPYKVVVPPDTLDIAKKIFAEGLYKELWPEMETETEEPIDTVGTILKDWASERYYKETIFDSDTLGKCVVDATVKYNRLNLTGYEFTPKVKTIERTIYTMKKWSPFVSAGAMFGVGNEMPETMGEVGGGIFYNEKFGAELKYQRGFNSKTDYIGGAVLFKF